MKVIVFVASVGILAAGCSGGGGGSSAPRGEHHHYVASSLTLPLTVSQANDLGADLDGDGTVDNQLGSVLSALVSAGIGLDLQGMADEAILRGTTILLADVQATSLTDASRVGFATFDGSNPSPAPCTVQTNLATCGRHLTGTASFDIAAGSATDGFVTGEISGGAFAGDGGELVAGIGLEDAAIRFPLRLADARLTGLTATTIGPSSIAGAMTQGDLDDLFVPAFYQVLADVILRDCTGGAPPTCGCMSGSTGESLLGVLDEVPDCDVTLADFRNHSLFGTLLVPDVDTDGDGTDDALSVGIGFTAVSATFTQPN